MQMLKSLGVSFICLSAVAADYHWTGNAGDGKWSSSGNWADSSGNPKSAAPTSGTAYSYSFANHADGETVVQDVASVIASELTVGAGALTISSAADCKFAFVKGNQEIPVTLSGGATFTMRTDLSSDSNGMGINLTGSGTVVLDWPSPCGADRKININSSSVVLRLANAGAASNCRVALNLKGTLALDCDAYVKDMYYEWGEGNHVGSSIALNGHVLTIGAGYNQDGVRTVKSTYVGLGGTVKYAGQVVEKFEYMPPAGGVEIACSKVSVGSMGTFALGAGETSASPLRAIGSLGLGLVAPNGMPDVVADATRGNVLGFDGTKYLRGAGENGALGLVPTGSKAPFTLAFWMKPDADCSGFARMFFWGAAAEDQCFGLQQLRGYGSMFGASFYPANKDLGHQIMWCNNGVNLVDGNWHHVAVVYGGGGTIIYVDGGVAMSNGDSNGAYPNITDANFMIGGVSSDITGFWIDDTANYKGLLDEIVLLPSALSADDVVSLRDNGAADFVGRRSSVKVSGEGSLTLKGDSVRLLSVSGSGVTGSIRAPATTVEIGAEAGSSDSGTYAARLVSTAATAAKLVKEGEDYDLTFAGTAVNVDKVAVNAGTLELKQPVARQGLVVYYPFESLDTVGKDAGMLGCDLGTIQPSGSADLSIVSDGVRGSAVHFAPSAKTCLESSDSCSLPAIFPKGNDSFTFSVWIRPDAAAVSRSVIFTAGKWSGPGEKKVAMLGFSGATQLQFSTESGRDMNVNVPALDDGKWHHVAAVYDAALHQKRLYVDGTLMETRTLDAMNLTDRRLAIGRFESDAPDYFDLYSGDMDEFMVLNCAWGAEEVAAECAAILPAKADASTMLPKPVARWTFDDAAAPGKDVTGNGCDLTVQGTASVVADDEADGKALSLTGAGYLTFASGAFPSVLPTIAHPANISYSVVCRYRPNYTSGTPNQCVLAWGGSSDMSHLSGGVAVRCKGRLAHVTAGGKEFAASGDYQRTATASAEQSWTTVVVVYDALSYDWNDQNRMIRWYLNGERQACEPKGWVILPSDNFYIGSYADGSKFNGLIDDVAIYDRALSDGEARIITRTLSAHNGGLAPKCFATSPDVTVADGATLKVSTSEPVKSLAGAGSVVVDRLVTFAPTSLAGFTGSVGGLGTFGYPAGHTFTVADTATSLPLVDSEGAIAIGANAAFNVARTESGTFTLLHADGGITCENLASLTATGFPNAENAKFKLANGGKDLVLRVPAGMVLIIR